MWCDLSPMTGKSFLSVIRAVSPVPSDPEDIRILPTVELTCVDTHNGTPSSPELKFSSASLQVKSLLPTYVTFITFPITYVFLIDLLDSFTFIINNLYIIKPIFYAFVCFTL